MDRKVSDRQAFMARQAADRKAFMARQAADRAAGIGLDTRLELASIAIDVAMEAHLKDVQPAPVAPAQTRVHSSEILDAARLELNLRGWHQGRYESETGKVCVLEAINRVAVNGPARDAAVRMLMNRIESEHGNRFKSIWEWNDAPTTTYWDVVGMLR